MEKLSKYNFTVCANLYRDESVWRKFVILQLLTLNFLGKLVTWTDILQACCGCSLKIPSRTEKGDKDRDFPFLREHYTADDDVRKIISVALLALNFRTGWKALWFQEGWYTKWKIIYNKRNTNMFKNMWRCMRNIPGTKRTINGIHTVILASFTISYWDICII